MENPKSPFVATVQRWFAAAQQRVAPYVAAVAKFFANIGNTIRLAWSNRQSQVSARADVNSELENLALVANVADEAVKNSKRAVRLAADKPVRATAGLASEPEPEVVPAPATPVATPVPKLSYADALKAPVPAPKLSYADVLKGSAQ